MKYFLSIILIVGFSVIISSKQFTVSAINKTKILIQIQDPGERWAVYHSGLNRCLTAALETLLDELIVPPELTIRVNVFFTKKGTGCSSTEFVAVGGGSDGMIFEQGFAALLRDPLPYKDRPYHINVQIDMNSLPHYWFDPDPKTRQTPLPKTGQVEAMTVFLHEYLHALVFNGWLNSATGESLGPNNTQSTYDRHVIVRGGRLYFNGPNAVKIFGGPVPLHKTIYLHYGGKEDHLKYSLSDKLMYGEGHTHPIRVYYSDLDRAILKDCGIKLKSKY